MAWREAILKVLTDSETPLHYAEIAQAIIDNGYRRSVGATPAATVAGVFSTSRNQEGEASPFLKVSRGMYRLRSRPTAPQTEPIQEADEATEAAQEMGLINALGMFWRRSEVLWKPGMPRLLGVQQSGSSPVNFTEQAGVYLLYDGSRVVYVGRVTQPRLGARLWEHTRDRLTGRWDRFSWFGVRGIDEGGGLRPIPVSGLAVTSLIATMEALLIEGLEPPQNRRQGDGFNAVEFLQETDDDLTTQRKQGFLAEISKEIGL